ncbi:hypothetical protein ASE17_20060 [Phenylobacterium sp. Root77]|jgi:uncharacterized protein (TIGR02588 family)|uniref:hypothetical protein n=1 Tax=unclassified Phenylobacterium TaxID=2640670 RepID=UPI0006FFE729|nr:MULTISPECIES: hypothetical protein [unclassified Phenylobacterium]KQW66942.1 hypothetical protein ASC73_17545 [Phenylobacterium sp. Root1277]KQW89636.1 hypothetical protein ASC79_18450 [Phenylobacterium sp. Root1290]KRC43495.1 hypothetical protein ASE17_20060 [Phenylobacterium sp. Root77]
MTAAKPKSKPTSPRAASVKDKASPARKSAPSPGSQSAQTPLLEWIAAGVGAALILAVLSVIVLDIARAHDAPPDLVVRSKGSERVANGYLLHIEIKNRGDQPAAQVDVEGRLGHGAAAQTASVTFDDVPGGSVRSGGLLFKSDPRGGAVELSAKGFTDP